MSNHDYFGQVQQLAGKVAGRDDPPMPQMLKGQVTAVDNTVATCSVKIGGSATAIPGIRWLASVYPVVNDIVYLWQNGPDLFVVDKIFTQITPWITVTLNAGWTLYTGYPAAAYKRVGEVVSVMGTLNSTAPNTVAFTLPQGFRPRQNAWFGGYSACEGYVDNSGQVVPIAATGNTYGITCTYLVDT